MKVYNLHQLIQKKCTVKMWCFNAVLIRLVVDYITEDIMETAFHLNFVQKQNMMLKKSMYRGYLLRTDLQQQ